MVDVDTFIYLTIQYLYPDMHDADVVLYWQAATEVKFSEARYIVM